MLTGELRSQVDRVWDASGPGGISNPWKSSNKSLTCSSSAFDELHTVRELKANRLGRPDRRADLQPDSRTCAGRASKTWIQSRCMPWIVEQVFPFMKNLGGDGRALLPCT